MVDADDAENLDPTLFSKRSKGAGADGSDFSKNFFKPASFILTKAPPAPAPSTLPITKDGFRVPTKPASSRPRNILQAKSPAARLNTKLSTSAPSSSLTAPAGRSPTRGSKRIGILSRRRTQRIDPPSFSLGSAAPFSLDAALKGTIPSYKGGSSRSSNADLSLPLSSGSGAQSSWFFDIHEDTPEQEMTNMLQHSTCTLDISSDEESSQKMKRESAEGRDKENVPPLDDASQTSTVRNTSRVHPDDMMVEETRGPLAEMNAADYYAEGLDDTSVFIIPGEEEEEVEGEEEQPPAQEPELQPQQPTITILSECDEALRQQESEQQLLDLLDDCPTPQPETYDDDFDENVSVDVMMAKDEGSSKAAVLQPMEGTGESFVLWESGSFRDETSMPGSPALGASQDEALPVAIAC